MSEHILPGMPPIALSLRRSSRAKRMSLRISSLDGRVTLTIPTRTPEHEALTFAQEKSDWIRRHLSAQPDAIWVDIGSEIPIEGHPVTIRAASSRTALIQRETTCLYVASRSATKRVERYLKELARTRFVEACDLYAARLGRNYSRMTLRDTRSRWGSCSSAQALMFSWRLVMAPPPILQYVAAHEVAHLAQMNHSPAFWATVERIHGPYQEYRQWLRQEGLSLHRYKFDTQS